MLALAVVAAAGAGLVLGLLGGGGSILTLPILVYLAGMPTRPAIAASLVVVAATSAVAVVPHALAGRVRWRTALPFAAAGIAGAYGGGRLADLVPGPVLLAAFGLMAALAAAVMLRPRRAGPGGTDRLRAGRDRSAGGGRQARPVLAATMGGLVGLVTGLVGAGGGFVIVPVLVVLGGLGMVEAVGTSLLVIAVQSAAGLAGHLPSVRLDWPVVAAVTAAAIVGSLAGARLVARIPQAALRTGFGWLVLVMAALILAQQVPAGLWRWLAAGPAGWSVIAGTGVVVTGASLVDLRRRCRRRSERHESPV